MKHINIDKATAILAILFLFNSCFNKDTVATIKPSDFYHFNKNRVASEWEHVKGVIFMCPPVIPEELIIEFAGDTHLYPVVESEEVLFGALEWFA